MSRFEIFSPGLLKPIGQKPFFDREIPATLHKLKESAAYFEMDAALATAVNVALCVGQPLLLTGDTGTGKTQLAFALAYAFETRDKEPYVLPVKSTTVSRDLLYTFDTVAYFRTKDGELGEKEKRFLTRGPLWNAFIDVDAGLPAVVLIDEIDKAPRDFPNDLLFELDQYTFHVPELNKKVERTNPHHPPPFVVVTSNSERRLPEPFLRRCIFHHIQFSKDVVKKAIERRKDKEFPSLDDDTIDTAIARLLEIRDNKKIKKKPATAEFLSWLRALDAGGKRARDLQAVGSLPYVNALVKDRDDLAAVS